ncbi:hypothetical protein [Microcystis phage Mel-JY01]
MLYHERDIKTSECAMREMCAVLDQYESAHVYYNVDRGMHYWIYTIKITKELSTVILMGSHSFFPANYRDLLLATDLQSLHWFESFMRNVSGLGVAETISDNLCIVFPIVPASDATGFIKNFYTGKYSFHRLTNIMQPYNITVHSIANEFKHRLRRMDVMRELRG